MKFPWEVQLPAMPVEDTVKLIQSDLACMVQMTAILVHSNRPEFEILVNTRRGQIVPRGECKFTDGSKFELQDIGMPQPSMPTMTVQELMAYLWSVATDLKLELQT